VTAGTDPRVALFGIADLCGLDLSGPDLCAAGRAPGGELHRQSHCI